MEVKMKMNLNTDILYQADSIVSKTILKNEGGNITLFAFDKGQSLSEHTAPYDAMFYCIEGKFNVSIGNEQHVLTAGDVMILPSNIPHAVNAGEASKCMLTMIKVK
jgi:quercetin dioxygenase-like cupin family protein